MVSNTIQFFNELIRELYFFFSIPVNITLVLTLIKYKAPRLIEGLLYLHGLKSSASCCLSVVLHLHQSSLRIGIACNYFSYINTTWHLAHINRSVLNFVDLAYQTSVG